MTHKVALVFTLGLALAAVVACQQQDQTPSAAMGRPAVDAAAAPQVNSNAMRPPPRDGTSMRSGLNGDPANPSGAPGPGDGTGTSSIH